MRGGIGMEGMTRGLNPFVASKGTPWWKIGAALDFDFQNQRAYNKATGLVNTPDSLLTVTRASGAGRWLSTGLYYWDTTNNTLRYGYSPTSLQPLGVLIEEQRTNITLRSEDCTVAPWADCIGTTSTKANTASPWHNGNAFQITATSVNGGIRQVISVASSSRYYSSFVVQSNIGVINILSENGAAAYGVAFSAALNTATGVVSGANAGQVYVVAVTGGWLVKVNWGTSGATAGRTLNLELKIQTNGQTGLFAMIQTELGIGATSYIPTTAASATRAAESAYLLTSSFPYNASEGTLVCELPAEGTRSFTSGGLNLVTISNGTSLNDRIVPWITSSPQGSYYVSVGGVAQAFVTDAAVIGNAAYKQAVAYKANDFATSINGAAVLTDTSGSVPTVDRMFIGSGPASTVQVNNHIKRVTYYPVRKTDTELRALAA